MAKKTPAGKPRNRKAAGPPPAPAAGAPPEKAKRGRKKRAPGDPKPRVVSLPIREVVSAAAGDRHKVLSVFTDPWRRATALANWCQRWLALSDPGLRAYGDAKIAPYDPKCLPGGLGLYSYVTAACPFRSAFDGAAGSMSAVIKAVEDAWRGHPRFGRFAVLWRGEARPAVFRYPFPWPVRSAELRIMRLGDHAQVVADAAAAVAPGAPADPAQAPPPGARVVAHKGRPHATLSLPGGRVTVRLADGRQFRRQLAQFDFLLANPDRLKQAKVTGRFKDGRLVGADLRLVGEFDVRKAAGATAAAVVTTGPGALLAVAVDGAARPFVYHGNELKAVVAQHELWAAQLATDLKFEKRWPSWLRRRRVEGPAVVGRRDRIRNRLKCARHEVTTMVVNYLARQGVGAVSYHDADKTFLPRWDWSGMRALLEYKCAGRGIAFHHATPPKPPKPGVPPEEADEEVETDAEEAADPAEAEAGPGAPGAPGGQEEAGGPAAGPG